MGRPSKQRSEETARQVEQLAQYGLPMKQISAVVGLAINTIYKYYSEELDKGAARANLNVAKRLYEKCVKDGDTAALIFWAKTRMRWKEDAPEDTSDQAAPAVKVKVEDAGRKRPAKADAAPQDAGADG